jgi:hypothetical protein
MEILEGIEIYPKIIVALTGLFAVIMKIRESFSAIRQKQEIKIDLEIYELIQKSHEFNNNELKNLLNKRFQNPLIRKKIVFQIFSLD